MVPDSYAAQVAPEMLQATRRRGAAKSSPLRRHVLAFCCLCCLLGACASGTPHSVTPPTSDTLRLKVLATPSDQTLLADWVAQYEGTHSGVVLEVRTATLAGAQGDLSEGNADLALLDQEPAPFYGGVLTATHVADEPLAVIVNLVNPLRDLSAAVLVELFGGRVADWGEAGGAAGPVQVYVLPDSAGAVRALTRTAMGGRTLARQAIVCASVESLQQAVAADPFGIGFLPAVSVSSGVAILRVDGRFPGEARYPWQMPLYLTEGPASPLEAQEFVEYVRRAGK